MLMLQKKQYVLSSQELKLPETVFIKLPNGYLYVNSELPILQTKDLKGRNYIIIGIAICTDIYPKQIKDDINGFESDSLIDLTKNWTGRWVLIRDSELITDATGLMSAFYWNNGDEWMISSSLSLISKILQISITKSISNSGLDWYLLPNTIVPNVKVLFCTQKIKLNRSIEIFSINRFSDKRKLSSEEKIHEVTSRLVTALKNIEKFIDRDIIIALTAGKDSRLVIAAALSANVKFSAYTMEHPKMLIADKKLPGKIAKKYGFPWTFIRMNTQNNNLADDYLRFNGGNSKGADILFYSSGQSQQIPNNSLVIRSGIFEAGQLYGRRTMGETMESMKAGFYKYYKKSLQDEEQKYAFEKWLRYVVENPISFVDIRDRFYIEQRVNGWVSAIEQALTINSFDTLQIANCQELISILLSANDEERKNNQLALAMIKSLMPELLDFPVNKTTLFDKLNVIKRIVFKNFFKC